MTKHQRFTVGDLKLANDHHILEVEVYYSEGGWNAFTGERESKGNFLSVFPVEKVQRDGYSTRSFMIGGGKQGYKGKLEDAHRYNAKRLEAIADDLKKFGENSVLWGADYKRLVEACCKANNFTLATTEAEAYKVHVFGLGERFTLIDTDRSGIETDCGAGVVTYVRDDGRYDAIMDDDTTRSYLQAVSHSVKMVSLGKSYTQEQMEMRKRRIETVEAEADERKKAREREKTERYETALRGIKADFPNAVQVGSRQARGAKNCKAELQTLFPGVSFSVTSDKFAGGDSMSVSWIDGPKDDKVTAIIDKYEDFESMDVSDYVHTKHTPEHQAVTDWLGGARYVKTYREYSHSVLNVVRAEAFKRYGEYSDFDFQFGAVSICSRSDIFGAFVTFFDLGKEVSAIFEPNTATEAVSEPEPVTDEAVSVRENEAMHGIEIRFKEKPDEDTRSTLKRNGFKWSKYQKMWWAKATDARWAFAYGLAGQDAPAAGGDAFDMLVEDQGAAFCGVGL